MDYFSQTQPKAEKYDIFRSANNLLIENGRTTVSDVKFDLRSRGYLVFPTDVAYWLNILAKEQNWIYTFNGHYRVYHFAPNPQWLNDLLEVCSN